jgi:hypothetical protein
MGPPFVTSSHSTASPRSQIEHKSRRLFVVTLKIHGLPPPRSPWRMGSRGATYGVPSVAKGLPAWGSSCGFIRAIWFGRRGHGGVANADLDSLLAIWVERNRESDPRFGRSRENRPRDLKDRTRDLGRWARIRYRRGIGDDLSAWLPVHSRCTSDDYGLGSCHWVVGA